jgi:hypothetical protein
MLIISVWQDQEFFEMFDLSPQAFPWTDARRDAIVRRRDEEMDGELFFDALLKLAEIDADSLYPPRDIPTFHHLVNAILDTSWDDFQQSCLIYYLLRHWEDGREKPFAQSKLLPPQFMFVSDAYYLLDAERSEVCVSDDLRPSVANQQYRKPCHIYVIAGSFTSLRAKL